MVGNRSKDHVIRYTGLAFTLDLFPVFLVARRDCRGGSPVLGKSQCLNVVEGFIVGLLLQAPNQKRNSTVAVKVPKKRLSTLLP